MLKIDVCEKFQEPAAVVEFRGITEGYIFHCRTTSASTARYKSRRMCCPTHCASNCAPCQPCLRACPGWIRSPPPTGVLHRGVEFHILVIHQDRTMENGHFIKVTLQDTIDWQAFCGANLDTSPPKFGSHSGSLALCPSISLLCCLALSPSLARCLSIPPSLFHYLSIFLGVVVANFVQAGGGRESAREREREREAYSWTFDARQKS